MDRVRATGEDKKAKDPHYEEIKEEGDPNEDKSQNRALANLKVNKLKRFIFFFMIFNNNKKHTQKKSKRHEKTY